MLISETNKKALNKIIGKIEKAVKHDKKLSLSKLEWEQIGILLGKDLFYSYYFLTTKKDVYTYKGLILDINERTLT